MDRTLIAKTEPRSGAGVQAGRDSGAVRGTRHEWHPRLVSLTDPASYGAERFRALAARLAHADRGRVIQVTSSAVGDGKSLVAANLAIALSRQPNGRVLLIDGDLHNPMLPSLFGVRPGPGLGDWWACEAIALEGYLQRIEGTTLSVLTAGSSAHSSDLLQSPAIAGLLATQRQCFDWIVIDSPPILPMADANLWARVVDGTILVVRESETRLKQLLEGIRALDAAKVLGCVLNDASEEQIEYYKRYYVNRRKIRRDDGPHPAANSGHVVRQEGEQR